MTGAPVIGHHNRMGLFGKSIASIADLDTADLQQLLLAARRIRNRSVYCNLGKFTVLALFMAQSFRSRVSFEKAVTSAGGKLIALNQNEIWTMTADEGIPMYGGAVEHAKDAAKSLSQYVDLIAIRQDPRLEDAAVVQADSLLKSFVQYSSVPVLNLGSGMHRPLQAVADLLSIDDHFKGLMGLKIVINWTYHPQPLPLAPAASMLQIAARFGMNVFVASPRPFELPTAVTDAASQAADAAGGSVTLTENQTDALMGADAVFACSWGAPSYYGNWDQEKIVRERLKDWQLDGRKMRLTKDARFLHPLPIRRNIAATDEVVDSHYSLVYEQAANLQAVHQAALAQMLSQYTAF